MLGRLLTIVLLTTLLTSCAYQRALREEKEAAKNPKPAVTTGTTIEAPAAGSSVSNINAGESGAAEASRMISPLTSY